MAALGPTGTHRPSWGSALLLPTANFVDVPQRILLIVIDLVLSRARAPRGRIPQVHGHDVMASISQMPLTATDALSMLPPNSGVAARDRPGSGSGYLTRTRVMITTRAKSTQVASSGARAVCMRPLVALCPRNSRIGLTREQFARTIQRPDLPGTSQMELA